MWSIIVIFGLVVFTAFGLIIAIIIQIVGDCREAYESGTAMRFLKRLVIPGVLAGLGLCVFIPSVFESGVSYLYQHQAEGSWIVYGIILFLIILLYLMPNLTYYIGHNNMFRSVQVEEEGNEEGYEVGY